MKLEHHDLADHVFKQLDSTIKSNKSQRIIVGFSGGIDSSVLLHAVASIRPRLNIPVLAVHVDHGVNPASGQWAQFCRDRCALLDIELEVDAYRLAQISKNKEATYRKYRYQSFGQRMSANDILLTAHHQQDQAETLLFNLFRGAGAAGLSAMPALKALANGWHLRPLLQVSLNLIEQYANHHQLKWLDDPSNRSAEFDRNYIRQQLLPQITKRWPSAVKKMAHSAYLAGQTQAILTEVAQQDINTAKTQQYAGVIKSLYHSVLDARQLNALSVARKYNAIRKWLTDCTASVPDSALLDAVINELLVQQSGSAMLAVEGYQLRSYKHYLYFMSGFGNEDAVDSQPMIINQREVYFSSIGLKLLFAQADASDLEFKFWRPGIKLKFNGQTKDIKKLYQQAQIPVWERAVLPLVFHAGEFVTIAGSNLNQHYHCSVEQVQLLA